MNTADLAKLPAKEIERLARNVQPGAWSVESEKPLSTLLGSCVAVCLFDPALKIGGINHFMLPEMGRSKYGDVDSLLSGNFAMEALLNALLGRGARKPRLQAKAFGGGGHPHAAGLILDTADVRPALQSILNAMAADLAAEETHLTGEILE